MPRVRRKDAPTHDEAVHRAQRSVTTAAPSTPALDDKPPMLVVGGL